MGQFVCLSLSLSRPLALYTVHTHTVVMTTVPNRCWTNRAFSAHRPPRALLRSPDRDADARRQKVYVSARNNNRNVQVKSPAYSPGADSPERRPASSINIIRTIYIGGQIDAHTTGDSCLATNTLAPNIETLAIETGTSLSLAERE